MTQTGVVKNWNEEKGFGFIGPDDGSEDVFCHTSSLTGGAKGLGKGDKVRFNQEFDDRKGKMRAQNVSLESGGGGGGGGLPPAALAGRRRRLCAPAALALARRRRLLRAPAELACLLLGLRCCQLPRRQGRG
mmetsp:Transcript_36644/g.83399  ORF Transcript_36644/g.83399 Transcript_36644/m.83399 type:complete len:132 (-) Transcript_36644:22-417(-)